MNYVIKTGKTVDEAVREALSELNITRDSAEIEVLDEGQKGFLGLIGSKDATVKVWPKVDETKSILNEIFNEEIEPETSQEVVHNTDDELEFEKEEVSTDEVSMEEAVKTLDEENEEIIGAAREFLGKILETLELDLSLIHI